ncbi:c6 transcription [Venturia nashicola]|uniref:C6 transcription n=1 Tax=Venturia nashicola TaxID=86259 RepID=A0A4Z1PLT1_9PEZI|nr:c6 transcription [Venturia nashicola]TLD38894.1 c6 transcription [Venturia nashicola]
MASLSHSQFPSLGSLPETDINTLGSLPETDINTLGSLPETDINTLGSLPETDVNALGSLPEADVNEILHRKRKARSGQKSCYPCRQRKVKCSHNVPCKTCIEREHPELCSYNPPSNNLPLPSPGEGSQFQTVGGSPRTGGVQDGFRVSREEWDGMRAKVDTIMEVMVTLRDNIQQVSRPLKRRRVGPGSLSDDDEENRLSSFKSSLLDQDSSDGIPSILANNQLLGEQHDTFLGRNSVPAMVVAMGKGDEGVQQLIGKSVLPVFGLDNDSATYPFVDLWGMPHGSIMRIQQLCSLIPSDSECLQYFTHYKETAHVLYPGVADVPGLEYELIKFLTNRRNHSEIISDGNPIETQKAYGKDLHWIGLLFATLASGCQCSGRPRKERQLMSQVWVCCAYECLRIINYLSHSNLYDVQNLLVLGNVISNNMNAGVAWSLLGLISRLAQSQGLHREASPFVAAEVNQQRSHVWWQIIWQDSLLSITYDRASSTAKLESKLPPRQPGQKMNYVECMRTLCKTGLEIIHERNTHGDSKSEMAHLVETRKHLLILLNEAADHLRDNKLCRSIKQQLEYWNLYLHRSYMTSELCRPILRKRHNPEANANDIASSIRKSCIESLADTVEAFIGLQNVTKFACQSWAAVHRSLSSALLLGILREPSQNERVHMLLSKLISVMSSINTGMEPLESSAPITRSIEALKKFLPPVHTHVETPGFSIAGTTGSSMEELTTPPHFAMGESPYMYSSDEHSPYSIMDNILWGGDKQEGFGGF